MLIRKFVTLGLVCISANIHNNFSLFQVALFGYKCVAMTDKPLDHYYHNFLLPVPLHLLFSQFFPLYTVPLPSSHIIDGLTQTLHTCCISCTLIISLCIQSSDILTGPYHLKILRFSLHKSSPPSSQPYLNTRTMMFPALIKHIKCIQTLIFSRNIMLKQPENILIYNSTIYMCIYLFQSPCFFNNLHQQLGPNHSPLLLTKSYFNKHLIQQQSSTSQHGVFRSEFSFEISRRPTDFPSLFTMLGLLLSDAFELGFLLDHVVHLPAAK